jgi:nicotinamide N-methyltransferase
MGLLRSSVLSATASDRPTSNATSLFPYHDPFSQGPRSTSFLGPPSLFPPGQGSTSQLNTGGDSSTHDAPGSTITYHGVCLTVWSHADAERSAAIRRTLEANRSRKESAQSLVTARLKSLRADAQDPTLQARRNSKRSGRGPWTANGVTTDGETDLDGETDGGVSESDYEVGSRQSHNPGESTLFLPGDAVFWLPYALSKFLIRFPFNLTNNSCSALVSRHPIYDLMRDYLTLSWARFSKDVQSHSLQISKILSHPAPRAGDLIKLDASATSKSDSASAGGPDTSLEVIARFPGGLDFGRGLVDINFTMWPLFKALNIDNILTICEVMCSVTLPGYGTHTAKRSLWRQQGGSSSFLVFPPCSGCVSF